MINTTQLTVKVLTSTLRGSPAQTVYDTVWYGLRERMMMRRKLELKRLETKRLWSGSVGRREG